jgi:predicted permease
VLSQLLAILLPVVVCVAIGWTLARRGKALPSASVTVLVADVGGPCLTFHSLAQAALDPARVLEMAGATAAAIVIFALLGFAAARVFRWPAHSFVPPVTFANTGNMGLPLCMFAFGEDALGLAVACFAMFTVFQFSLGIWVWTGKSSAREALSSPILWGSLIGFCFAWFRIEAPAFVLNTTRLLGNLSIPLMLITLGVSLAGMRVTSVTRSLVASGLRLIVGPAVGLVLADAFELTGDARGVLILQCAMPVAVFNYLLALRYGRDAEDVASLIVASTLLSLVTLPLLLSQLI